MTSAPPRKVLFAHTPKTGGLHLCEYFAAKLDYPRIQSTDSFPEGVWRDFTPDGLRAHIGEEHAFVNTHLLAYGWSELVECIQPADKSRIVALIREFRAGGWFTFTFVRHPGELLCSFYHYVWDSHRRGWHDAVARHTAVLDRSLDEFVAEHCERELLPDYWRELDFVGVASDEAFSDFFREHFDHVHERGAAPSHASGSRGYVHYCQTGEISSETAARIERSRNMEIFREISQTT